MMKHLTLAAAATFAAHGLKCLANQPPPEFVDYILVAFHKIGEPPHGTWRTWNYVPEDEFVRFLELLDGDGWRVIDLETFVAACADPSSVPERTAYTDWKSSPSR